MSFQSMQDSKPNALDKAFFFLGKSTCRSAGKVIYR